MIIQANMPNISPLPFRQKIIVSHKQFSKLPLWAILKAGKCSGFPYTINEAR